MNTRSLYCTKCGDLVHVTGNQVDHIDPDRYVCLEKCHRPVAGQTELPVEGHRVEDWQYNPDQVDLPF